MQHAAVGVVLVAALEVVLRVHGHIACGHLDVLVVRDVDARRVVHLIIGARSNGEARYGTLAVVEHRVYIRWKHALVFIVHLDGGVGPP